MPRALNQTLAWVISGGMSAAIFGGIVGMMLSTKPDSSEHVGSEHSAHGEHAAEHKAEGGHDEHPASGHDTGEHTASSDHGESAHSETKGEHADTHASHEGSGAAHNSDHAAKPEAHSASKDAHDGGEEVEIKADSFQKKEHH